MSDPPNLSSEIVLLLTATIDVRNVVGVKRGDPRIRLLDYVKSLTCWLSQPAPFRIVFCENSLYDLSELRQAVQSLPDAEQRVEFLSFEGQNFPPQLGKGFGEMGIIAHALEHSRHIRSATRILKVTGRHYIPNIARVLQGLYCVPDAEVVCDMLRGLTFADSRIFCATQAFFQEYLLPYRSCLDDSAGIYFEHVLARGVHRAMADGKRWSLYPVPPLIRGISATEDVVYRSGWTYAWTRQLFGKMKRFVLSR